MALPEPPGRKDTALSAAVSATGATPTERRPATVPAPVLAVSGSETREHVDLVAAEEPMEVRVLWDRGGRTERHSIAVTMRTPGHDFELAAGFLFSEGVVRDRNAIREISYCLSATGDGRENIVNVFLSPGTPFDPARFIRQVTTTSSCGICGRSSIDLVQVMCPEKPVGTFRLDAGYFRDLPGNLRREQILFSQTGGLHASALFDADGEMILLREDVGRHNALDKVVGNLLQAGRLPGSNTVLMVSGRASYELVQKAILAGIPVLAAVGAPSSLAVNLARESGLTLIGFLRKGRFNVYAGKERVACPSSR